ncbi:MAG: ABC transporter permease, partial [Myxococcota bacterium]|nr:ABC transporter permease [Myxococcota bacterium]
LRAALTVFGLVWGAAAVIFLAGWGEGLRAMNEAAFQRAGRNLIQIWPGRVSEDFSPAADRRYLWYTTDDVEALRERARLVERVAGETRTYLPAAFRQRAMSMEVRGVEPDGEAIRGVRAAAGRLISRSDVDHRRRVLVVGHRARSRLLGPQGGVGSVVRLDSKPFRVVGVLERVGTQLSRDGDELDDQLRVPLSTHLMLWPNPWLPVDMLSHVLVRTPDRHLVDETEAEVRRILAERLGVPPDDEEAVPSFSPVKMLRRIPIDEQNAVNFVIGATTILIGGVGVLTMMLDAVRERRTEIGIRLAVGARRRDVLLQFFLETACIVALGGLLGVALGIAGSWLLASPALRAGIPPALDDLIPVPVVQARVVAAAFAILGGTGLLAGIVPAWRASRVDPAVTLRAD